jgi:hypothetical protein
LPLLLALALLAAPAHAQAQRPATAPPPTPAPTTPLDGQWRGTSDGGSCNAPLDFAISIEAGIVDGTAYDTTARGPVPNPKRTAPPSPTPSLWQIHGVARPSGTFSLLATASVRGSDRREGRLTAVAQGGTLTVKENGGCGRTARLARG